MKTIISYIWYLYSGMSSEGGKITILILIFQDNLLILIFFEI